MKRPIGKIIPGSLRVEVYEYRSVTVQCCSCGHEQIANPDSKTVRCKLCRRQMLVQHGADVENVIPLRRQA